MDMFCCFVVELRSKCKSEGGVVVRRFQLLYFFFSSCLFFFSPKAKSTANKLTNIGVKKGRFCSGRVVSRPGNSRQSHCLSVR